MLWVWYCLLSKGAVKFNIAKFHRQIPFISIGIRVLSLAWGQKSSKCRFCSCSSRSCKFTVLTNDKNLLGMKVTSMWAVLHTLLPYWQWKMDQFCLQNLGEMWLLLNWLFLLKHWFSIRKGKHINKSYSFYSILYQKCKKPFIYSGLGKN